MDNRIERDPLMMKVAHLYSQRATCNRLSVGAVLALEGRIIAAGYNGGLPSDPFCSASIGCLATSPCTNTIHAEANLLFFCAKNGISTKDTTLYVTTSPCINCARAIIQSGIKRVVYLDKYRDTSPLSILTINGVVVEQITI